MANVNLRIARLECEVAELRELLAGKAERRRMAQQVATALTLHGNKLSGMMTTGCIAQAVGLPVSHEVKRQIGQHLRGVGLVPQTVKGIRFYCLDSVN